MRPDREDEFDLAYIGEADATTHGPKDGVANRWPKQPGAGSWQTRKARRSVWGWGRMNRRRGSGRDYTGRVRAGEVARVLFKLRE